MTAPRPLGCSPGTRFWDRETDADLVCLDRRAETHDIVTVVLAGAEGQYFAFQPGQYFTFDVPVDSGVEPRCYSISSSPLRPSTIAITVKRTAGGRASNWLHDRLRPGDTLRGMGPLGQFTPPTDRTDKLLLLCAGSGITPMMSIVRAYADACESPDTVLLHFARTPDDLAFREELSLRTRGTGPFRFIPVPETSGNGARFAGLTGRISVDLARAAVPDLAERMVMCCGPAPFMAAAREISTALGLPSDRYREESFDAPAENPRSSAVPLSCATSFNIAFSRQGKTIAVAAGESILTAARAQGVALPSSCANGVCGTCKSKLVSGRVEMRHNGGIRQREIDAGMILPCCAVPLEDLVIER